MIRSTSPHINPISRCVPVFPSGGSHISLTEKSLSSNYFDTPNKNTVKGNKQQQASSNRRAQTRTVQGLFPPAELESTHIIGGPQTKTRYQPTGLQ